MKTIDINEQAGLALVRDDDEIRYIPIADAPPMTEDAPLIKQYHYVARAHARGLIIERVDPLLPGWKRLEEYESFMAGIRRGR